MKHKDERTKMTGEVLNGVKVIKLYGWEPPMIEAIERIRRSELRCLFKAGLVKAIIDAVNFSSPFLVAVSAFSAYSLLAGHVLTPEVAFVSLALFNQMRNPITTIGLLMSQSVQAIVGNRRLKALLTADELVPIRRVRFSTERQQRGTAVSIAGSDFAWDDSPVPTLRNIELTVPVGHLVAVVGEVGSGKSSLLAAILGEMDSHDPTGRVGINGSVGYVSQEAWIQNLSLKENILFGRDYDPTLYSDVIAACALEPDIELLPNGDETEIGERGINLSGGQKARVSLARAVYQQCDIYLLDDPLSAVDSHVGRHIYEEVIGPKGMLAGKTRLLVTHAVSYLSGGGFDSVVVMKGG